MLSPCPECAHPIWSEVREVGSFGYVFHFDDEKRSDTYAEPIRRCPGCGSALTKHAPERRNLTRSFHRCQ